MPVQAPLQQGMWFGAFLAIGTTLVSDAVIYDPKASKEAKFAAQTALSVSLPFVLNEVFGLRVRSPFSPGASKDRAVLRAAAQ